MAGRDRAARSCRLSDQAAVNRAIVAFAIVLSATAGVHAQEPPPQSQQAQANLLTNDTGCVWRHTYDAESGETRPFRSGYVNVACDDTPGAPPHTH